ncbi:MAG: bifunctional hydroxymethylpyrimidine kinase/phosphomethylpyrimidine kinase [Candidatus Competibacteraceae bacterium]|nr:bifunctional hydroxymethylpyrimidine kinase/phosphomethylpyrimidine kinase [Candidatus Competibacteraceae bacterium]
MVGRVLIVAGSDSGGAAGIQADLKTVTALGGYGATAITALTAQNTRGVFAVQGVEPDFIARQISLVLEDIGADCIKTGMLHNSEVIQVVVGVLESLAPDTPLVVDPVMFAKGGESLLDPTARTTLVERLIPRATVLTPNIPEAEALSGLPIVDARGMGRVTAALLEMGPRAVLIKGGHLQGRTVQDLLVTHDRERVFTAPYLDTDHTSGTGCTLASAIATGLAQGLELEPAVARALAYVHEAIRTAPGLGRGRGPVNHGHTVGPFSSGS